MAGPTGDLSFLDALIQFIQTVGFPIFVACWFLFRTDKRLDLIADRLNEVVGRRKQL